ncbi:hypothetical protein DFH06DRAFT_1327916 [Mycena polygramma]|nr:hypothetical protein DFH06DRAFT_1327916 [Mycena polygramma]
MFNSPPPPPRPSLLVASSVVAASVVVGLVDVDLKLSTSGARPRHRRPPRHRRFISTTTAGILTLTVINRPWDCFLSTTHPRARLNRIEGVSAAVWVLVAGN